MRIGLISDTHGLLRAAVFDHFTDLDLVLHAGDVGNPDILLELEAAAPTYAVFGNTDGFDVRSRVKERIELELEGWKVLVTHGHELGSPDAQALREEYPHARVIVYGHTHVPRSDVVDGTLVVNPGAAGPARFKLRPSIAILELERERRDVQFIEL